MTNIRVWDVELPSNIRSSISAFNCTTQVWLRRCAGLHVGLFNGEERGGGRKFLGAQVAQCYAYKYLEDFNYMGSALLSIEPG